MQNQLWEAGIEVEAMGGNVPAVEVSGLTGKGLDRLVETISMVAELQEIRADTKGSAEGFVIESKFQKGLGWVVHAIAPSPA